jgi:anthranilate 1,2-dioxygenase small subunit
VSAPADTRLDSLHVYATAERLQARYVHCLDDDRLEEWPAFFTDRCLYKITSSENHERGLPVGLFFATSRGMLSDRVTALRKANIYEAQRYRHFVSSLLILEQRTDSEGLAVRAQSNFQVIRTMHDGTVSLFATGRYLDRILLDGETPRFVEKLVVCDSNRVDTLLAIPL